MMHHDREDLSFKNIRNIILSKSKSIFQDNTGFLSDTLIKTIGILSYGTYEKPIKF